jgi:amino acid transporter
VPGGIFFPVDTEPSVSCKNALNFEKVSIHVFSGMCRSSYAMSIDGLLPSSLSRVSTTRYVPTVATCSACVIVAFLSTFLDINVRRR